MQVPKGQDQVYSGVSVPCRHDTPVADAHLKAIFSNEKKKEILLRPMTKTPIPTENSKTKGQHKCQILKEVKSGKGS